MNDSENHGNHEEELDGQMRTISLKEYKVLMNLIPEVEKLRNTIKNLKHQIELRDAELKEEQLRQIEKAKYLNVSHCSAVSIFRFSSIRHHFYKIYFKSNICGCIYLNFNKGTKTSNRLFSKWN